VDERVLKMGANGVFKILDVGCGDKPRGDVNCDLYVGVSTHLIDYPHDLRRIMPKKIPNFVKCDAHFLPFTDNGFLIVIASHLLEHCKHPFDVLKELHRVASDKVIIKVPNLRKISREERPTHLFTWSEYSLRNLMEQFYSKVEIYSYAYPKIPPRILQEIPFFGDLLGRMLRQILAHEIFCENIAAIGVKTQ